MLFRATLGFLAIWCVPLACSDESASTGGDGSAGAGLGGAGGSIPGTSGTAGGGNAGGRIGSGGAGPLGGTAGMSGSAGSGGSAMGGEGGSDFGGEGGEGAIAGSGAGMGGNAMGGAGTGGGGAGTGGAGAGGAGVGGAGAGSAGTGGKGGAGAGGAGAGGAGAGGAGAGGAGAGGAGAGGAGAGGAGGMTMAPSFETRVLATDHVAEGADVGDIDGDNVLDLVAGPRWYKGPGFSLGGTLMPNPPTFTRDQYSTFFLTFVGDLDGDTRPDVIGVGDAGGGNGTGNPNAHWYRNPGPGNFGQTWTKTAIYSGLVANESPAYLDVVGDGRKELVFMTNNRLGYATPGPMATTPWTFTPVTPSSTSFPTPYVHGLGVGDVDGDGLRDIVERTGWWRQVAAANWERHTFDFGMGLTGTRPTNWGGAQMHVYDIDGDGDSDVVTGLFAHRYGISWFERQGTGMSATFVPHVILPATAGTGNFSQAHAMAVADVNGDGLLDIIAGKRYYAHPSTNPDPGTNEAVVLYWFELRRSGGTATFTPRLVHSDSGAGCNFVARDVTGDGKVDIFTTNKRGTFLHVQR